MTPSFACSSEGKEDQVFALWSLAERKDHTYMNDTGKNGCICHHTGTLGPQKHLLSSASW